MPRRFKILLILLLAFLSPWIVGFVLVTGATIYGKIDEWRYSPRTEFSEAAWKKPDLKYRYSVLEYVTFKVIPVGMDEKEVERLLGKPDSVSENGEWHYDARKPGWQIIDFSGGGLAIEFDAKRRVFLVSRDTWTD